MNAKAWQDLMLQIVQRLEESQRDQTTTLATVSQEIVKVRTTSDDMSDRLKNLEKNSHSAPCAEVQTLRERVTTGVRITR